MGLVIPVSYRGESDITQINQPIEIIGAGTRAGVFLERMNVPDRKKKITISLSEKSMAAIEELRKLTDADTDSEVFRNALRLHLTLLRAHQNGIDLFMGRGGETSIVPVHLFVPADDPSSASPP